MNVILLFFVFYFVTGFVTNQSTKEPQKDVISKVTIHDLATDPVDANKNSLWIRRPYSDVMDDYVPYKTVFKAPYSVTRLTKTHSPGFEPYFYKGHFEPFERRSKPVTLIALRKNGFMPRSSMRKIESKSMEIAELQSPYNDISSFWQDELTT